MSVNHNNVAAGIAIQVLPTNLVGPTGAGKTASVRSLMEGLGRRFLHLNVATHVAEDFAGYPNPDYQAGVVRMMAPSWVLDAADGNAGILFDEITCGSGAALAGALTCLSDRMVGEYRLPDTTIMVAACNPPELAPNSAPLPASIRSRFAHFDWQIDAEQVRAGFRAGCHWDTPAWPVVPAGWQDNLPYYGSLVSQFLTAHSDLMSDMPKDDDVRSFPTPRTWHFLVRGMAAAKACGHHDKSSVHKEMAGACVGTVAGPQFMKFIATLDLIDPASILDGSAEYEYTDRVDLNICLVTSLVSHLRSRPGDDAEDRWLRAAEVFCTLVDNGEIETVLLAFKSLWNDTKNNGVRPLGFVPPADVQSRLTRAFA